MRFFERFPYGVIGLGADRHVQFVNPRAKQMLGDLPLEVGEPLSAKILAEFGDLVLNSPEDTHMTHLRLPDGRAFRISGLGPQSHEPALLMLEDVTEQERHDRVMREFVRNAAHQLRTPLTAIATAVEVLQAGAKNVPADRDRFLEHVEAHSARLIRISHGLLALARAQSGEALPLNVVSVRPLLADLAAEAQPRHGVELVVDCEPELAALAEADLLQEALAALVDNAIEYTDAGVICLSATRLDGTVEVSVSDTGGGVPPEHRERIFEPFYRPSAEGHGFGLGLAIAAEAARAMKGDLRVDGADSGATFTLRLTAFEGPG